MLRVCSVYLRICFRMQQLLGLCNVEKKKYGRIVVEDNYYGICYETVMISFNIETLGGGDMCLDSN
jgi:hypothetical protein